MTKGERLIWQLFEMVRELMPVTEVNTRRFTEWAAQFHQMEHPEPETVATSDTEPAEDPHEHGVPPRRRAAKK